MIIMNLTKKIKNKLLLESNNCKFNYYTYGGYKYGFDRKWIKSKCEPSFYDIYYQFDYIKNKCFVIFVILMGIIFH